MAEGKYEEKSNKQDVLYESATDSMATLHFLFTPSKALWEHGAKTQICLS